MTIGGRGSVSSLELFGHSPISRLGGSILSFAALLEWVGALIMLFPEVGMLIVGE